MSTLSPPLNKLLGHIDRCVCLLVCLLRCLLAFRCVCLCLPACLHAIADCVLAILKAGSWRFDSLYNISVMTQDNRSIWSIYQRKLFWFIFDSILDIGLLLIYIYIMCNPLMLWLIKLSGNWLAVDSKDCLIITRQACLRPAKYLMTEYSYLEYFAREIYPRTEWQMAVKIPGPSILRSNSETKRWNIKLEIRAVHGSLFLDPTRPDPTRRKIDPNRPAIADKKSDPTRHDPRLDLSPICTFFDWIIIY